uniref:Uncharacterized protein n=1 Tax=Dunaliella tertiolecta TaxID=3047 RepID=A0A7S3QZC6_DUNTE|mmetsp:Transcript_3483/g.9286  ORF Transcript_3483/g.9286 Transcript_3483/m.9286 type:complete len:146 (+) Transcript_3483:100-537(+)
MKGVLTYRQSSYPQLVPDNCGLFRISPVAWFATSTPRCKHSTLQTLHTAHGPLWSGCSAARTTGTYNIEEEEQKNADIASPARLRLQRGARKERKPLVKPEVLAPAGGWPQVKAACENGADAVYFGTPGMMKDPLSITKREQGAC